MKRRKKYKPKGININAVETVVTLAKPVQENSKVKLQADIDIALLAFTKGVATKYHFDTLASTVDVAMIADQSTFNQVYRDEIMKAREGMIRCRERFIKTGKLGLDGEALQAIKTVAYIHRQQLDNITGAELLQMYRARHFHIQSGNYYKGSNNETRT